MREQKRWTQQELAAQLGVSRARIGQIETGTGAPISQDLSRRLNDLLGSNIEVAASVRRGRVRRREPTNPLGGQQAHPGLARAKEPVNQWMENLGGTFAPLRFAIPDLDPRTMWSKVIEWAIDEPSISRLKAIQGGNPTWWWGKRSSSAKQYHIKTFEFVAKRQHSFGFGAHRVFPVAKAEDLLSDDTVRRRFLEQVFCHGLDVGIALKSDAAPLPGMLLLDTADDHHAKADEPGPLIVRLDGPDHSPTTSEFSATAYDIEKGRADFQRLIRRAEWVDPASFEIPADTIPAEQILELAELEDEDWEERLRQATSVGKDFLTSQLRTEVEKCLHAAAHGRHGRH